jgi:hypothetical protein
MKRTNFVLILIAGIIMFTRAQEGWIPQSPKPVKCDFNDIHSPDSWNAWIACDSGVVLMTSCYGISWEPQYSGVTVNLNGVFCLKALETAA